MPIAVKVLFGLVVDRFNLFGYGHRISYMTFGLMSYGLAMAATFLVEPGRLFLGCSLP